MLRTFFQGNATSGMVFRYALIFVTIIIVVIFFIAAINYGIVRQAILNELRNQIFEETTLMENIVASEGPQSLTKIEFLDDPKNIVSTDIFALFDRDQNRLSGNLKVPLENIGWIEQSFQGLYPEPNGKYILLQKKLADGSSMVVGRSLMPMNNVLRTVTWLIVASVLVFAIMWLIISYLISRKTYVKIKDITDTLVLVADGHLDARIPFTNGTEQLERASMLINTQLNQLERVIATNKNTIQAIAHDLRSPLNRVSMLLQRAIDNNDMATVNEMIAQASNEIALLTEIFDTTLRISKISAGISTENFSILSVGTLLHEMVEIFEPVVEEQGDTLSVDIRCNETSKIFGDERMIKQLFVNLIENAVTHCPAPTRITLRCKQSLQGNTIIEVSDTGPGIAEEHRKFVLEPFQRLDTSRTTKGTGLGLALVAAIAERHAASVELDDNHPGLIVRIAFPKVG